jgi:small subunit ribosomal protein S4
MIKKKKKYVRPKKLYEKARIEEENVLVERYALKNKREIWKTLAKMNYYRSRAKSLAKSSVEEQQLFFNKLSSLGIKVNSIADVLALKIENILDRRLPTIVAKKGLTNTVKHARQLVVHKKVLIDGKAVNSPSYIVGVSEEEKISIKKKESKKIKVEEKVEEQSESNSEETKQ